MISTTVSVSRDRNGNDADVDSEAFVNCYSTSFRWWDYMLGTDNKVSFLVPCIERA
jgi:hypothetical protein